MDHLTHSSLPSSYSAAASAALRARFGFAAASSATLISAGDGPSSTFFFFNDPATTETYPLSLHDALPICLARPLELGNCLGVGQPREPLVRGGVRGEVEAPCLPPPDGVPIEMPQPVPRVAHIPRVQASYVVGDEKCGSREPHVGKYWIDVLGEGSVAVIERQKECGMRSTECGIAGLEPLGELV